MIDSFVINLRRRPDRLKAFQESISSVNLFPVRIDAIDGLGLTQNVLAARIHPWNHHNLSRKRLLGLAGCSMSHFRVWEIIAQEKEGYYLIFEDDARPVCRSALNQFPRIIRNLPSDADIIWLNGPSDAPVSFAQRAFQWLDRNLKIATFRNVIVILLSELRYLLRPVRVVKCTPKYWYTAESYILNPRSARDLVEKCSLMLTAPDNDLLDYTLGGRVVYRLSAPIFCQNKHLASDI
jgi:GR25 family glycosyltransferase involved in LPS biosynthesis